MKVKQIQLALAALTFSLFFLTACSNIFSGDDGGTKTAKLAYPSWTEGIAYTNVAKAVLENEMGYDCTISKKSLIDGFEGIASGDQDAYMEVWLPDLHQSYVDNYGSDIVDLTAIYDGTLSGLVVPQYVYDAGLTSISDLNDSNNKTNLSSEIQGISAESGLMQTLENEAVSAYTLGDYTILNDDTTTMISELDTAITNNEWIVVALWRPHWVFTEYNLKFLGDPQNIWSPGEIHIFGRAGIGNDKPELKAFLEDMTLTHAQLSELMLQMQNSSDSNYAVAQNWVENNQSVIQAWIP